MTQIVENPMVMGAYYDDPDPMQDYYDELARVRARLGDYHNFAYWEELMAYADRQLSDEELLEAYLGLLSVYGARHLDGADDDRVKLLLSNVRVCDPDGLREAVWDWMMDECRDEFANHLVTKERKAC